MQTQISDDRDQISAIYKEQTRMKAQASVMRDTLDHAASRVELEALTARVGGKMDTLAVKPLKEEIAKLYVGKTDFIDESQSVYARIERLTV